MMNLRSCVLMFVFLLSFGLHSVWAAQSETIEVDLTKQIETFSRLSLNADGIRFLDVKDDIRMGYLESRPIASPLPFNAMGMVWEGFLPDGANVWMEYTVFNGNAWRSWQPVPMDSDMSELIRMNDGWEGRFVSTLILRQRDDATQVRFRLILERKTGNPRIESVTLRFINSMEGPMLPEDFEIEESAPAQTSAVPKPSVVTREQWGADPPQCSYSYCTTTHIGVHHTAGVSDYNADTNDECAAVARAIQDYHMYTNGWCDIGYNYLICNNGQAFEGRGGGDDVVGAHDGSNCGSMGVVMLGYYHQPYYHELTQAAFNGLVNLAAWKADQQGIDPYGVSYYQGYGANMDNIYGHRDVKATACPGDNIYSRMDEIRDAVYQKINASSCGITPGSGAWPASLFLLSIGWLLIRRIR